MAKLAPTNNCPYCQTIMQPIEMGCHDCGISVKGDFAPQILANLTTEHQRFIEMFVMSSGSLKEIAALAGVSYPTVRSRLNKVIEALRVAIESQRDADGASSEKEDGSASAAEIIKRI